LCSELYWTASLSNPFLFLLQQLDIVIDNVAATVVSLEGVLSKLSKMTAEEANTFQLDHLLGGTSETLQRKSIERFAYL